jgi:hypothetical protein
MMRTSNYRKRTWITSRLTTRTADLKRCQHSEELSRHHLKKRDSRWKKRERAVMSSMSHHLMRHLVRDSIRGLRMKVTLEDQLHLLEEFRENSKNKTTQLTKKSSTKLSPRTDQVSSQEVPVIAADAQTARTSTRTTILSRMLKRKNLNRLLQPPLSY